MLKNSFLWGFLTFVFLFTPVTHVFAEENGDNGASLMEGPFVIIAFATVILMIYYALRD